MTPTEAVGLARYIRAHFPQQPIDEYTAEALEELLALQSLSDCRAAVLAIAERGEHWCAPTDVKAEVKRIRAKRIAAHPPVIPPPDLDPQAEIEWRRGINRRIGDGEVIDPDAYRGELKHRQMPELTAGTNQGPATAGPSSSQEDA